MNTLSTKARVNANDIHKVKVDFVFLETEPYVIKMIIHDPKGDAVWDIGRQELRDAVFGTLPSGLFDVIINRHNQTVRIYLRNETHRCCLDFKLSELKRFVFETYQQVSSKQEQDFIGSEIDEWISS